MAQIGKHRCARAGGRAAHHAGPRTELTEERVEIVGPDLLFALRALDQDVGGAGVAPIVQHHANAVRGDLLRERHELGETAPPAGDEREPRAARADDAIVDVDAAYPGRW